MGREPPGGRRVRLGEQVGIQRGPRQAPIGRPEVIRRWVIGIRRRRVGRAPRNSGQQHGGAEFSGRIDDLGGGRAVSRSVPMFRVALNGHAEARGFESLPSAFRPAATGGERLDEDFDALRVPQPPGQTLFPGGLPETPGLGVAQVRFQQVFDVRIAEGIEPQHGDGFARRDHPQALLIAPEPVRCPAREPEPRPAERIELSPKLVERGARIATPRPDLVESINEERLPGPLRRAGLGQREEITGRTAQRVVGPQRRGLPLELRGLSRSRIAE